MARKKETVAQEAKREGESKRKEELEHRRRPAPSKRKGAGRH